MLQSRPPLAVAFGVLLGATLMVFAASGDLWLDEIWSLGFAELATSPIELVTRYQHDNNHLLNTLFLYLLGHQENVVTYRLLAILSGVGTLVLLACAGARWGARESLAVVYMAGTSYPLVLYSSEARGYAPAMFFSVLSLVTLQAIWRSPRLWKLLVFWAAAVLGLLSHLTFVIVFASLLGLSLLRAVTASTSWQRVLLAITAQYALPVTFAVLLYVVYVRDIMIGGGPTYSTAELIGTATSLALGLQYQPWVGIVAAVCVVSLIAVGTWGLRRGGHDEWAFFPLVLVIVPGVFLAVSQSSYLHVRYFVVSFPFFYLLLAHVFTTCRRASAKTAALAVCTVIVLMTSHLGRVRALIVEGRGHYRQAITDIVNTASDPVVRIASDHDFRNQMVLAFYARFLPPAYSIRYVVHSHWGEETPDWYITHSQDLGYRPPDEVTLPRIGTYSLFGNYPYSGISGWSWSVYRRRGDTTHRP